MRTEFAAQAPAEPVPVITSFSYVMTNELT